jgi:hypothetical protein
MAILARTAQTVSSSSSGTIDISLSKPAGTVDGDKLVVVINLSAAGVTLTEPSGWTLTDSSTASLGSYFYEKTASSEGASWNWTGSVGGNVSWVGIVNAFYDDAGLGTPSTAVFTKTVDTSADTTPDNTGVTPTMSPGAMLLVLIGGKGAQATYSGYAVATDDPGTWVEDGDTNANVAGEACSAAMAHASGRNLITATGAFSATASTSITSCVWLISLQPTAFAFTANVVNLAASGKSPSESSAQTLSPNVVTLASAGQAATVTQGDPTVSNTAKNSETFTNPSKNTESFTNTTKNSETWTNVDKNSV